MYTIEEIGKVKNAFTQPADPYEMRMHESEIILREEFSDGLYRLEEYDYIQVLFYFHTSGEYSLKSPRYDGETRGVFASRSPARPSKIGITTVALLGIQGNVLRVKGLDAINETPVLDIKPFVPVLDTDSIQQVDEKRLKFDPRSDIVPLIKRNDAKNLLLRTGQLHGHFCPGVATGVMAGAYCMNWINTKSSQSGSDGMEKVMAIVEINSCFVDGIQFTTGCTLGNNGLIYRDLGKTAVTVAQRYTDPKKNCALRVCVKPGFMDEIKKEFPEFSTLFEIVVKNGIRDAEHLRDFKTAAQDVSFKIVEWDFDTIFTVNEVNPSIPAYAPIKESRICSICNESMMESKSVLVNAEATCYTCAREEYYQVEGGGIVHRCGI